MAAAISWMLFILFVVFGSLYLWGGAILASILGFGGAVLTWFVASGALFLTFGTFPFWLLVAIVSLFVAWCVSEDKDFESTDEMWSGTAVATVALFGLIVSIINKNLFAGYSGWTLAGLIILMFAGYLIFGAGWSRFKYIRFGRRQREKIQTFRTVRLGVLRNKHGLNDERAVAAKVNAGQPTRPDRHRRTDTEADREAERSHDAYQEAITYKQAVESMLEKARPENNIGRIMVWIGLWPWSVLAWVLRDPVQMVYELMLGVYEKAYKGVFGTLESEFQAAFAVPTEQPVAPTQPEE